MLLALLCITLLEDDLGHRLNLPHESNGLSGVCRLAAPLWPPDQPVRDVVAFESDAAGLIHVRRTVSDGQVVELGKTSRSRRQVPLSRRAVAALDRLPVRLDLPILFTAPEGGLLNLDNFRRREWDPAIEAANIAKPARIYEMRSTFASNALAAGVTVFELGKIMGSSVRMIERHYGALLDGAGAGISGRLDALEAELERAAAAEAADS